MNAPEIGKKRKENCRENFGTGKPVFCGKRLMMEKQTANVDLVVCIKKGSTQIFL